MKNFDCWMNITIHWKIAQWCKKTLIDEIKREACEKRESRNNEPFSTKAQTR